MTDSPDRCSADIAGLVAAIQAAWDASPSAPSSFRLAKIAAEVAAKQFGAPAQSVQVRAAAIEECAALCEAVGNDEYTNVHRALANRIRALAAQPPAAPVDNGSMYGEYTPVTVRASTAPLQSCSAATETVIRRFCHQELADAIIAALGEPQTPKEPCDGADDLEHLDGMFDDRERG
jgi:hypothetical protein